MILRDKYDSTMPITVNGTIQHFISNPFQQSYHRKKHQPYSQFTGLFSGKERNQESNFLALWGYCKIQGVQSSARDPFGGLQRPQTPSWIWQ